MTAGEFEFAESGGVVCLGAGDAVVPGVVGLDDDLPGLGSASGASGHLCEQLKRAFAGAEIRQVESQVREQHPHERDFREVVPLGDKLGADHQIHFVLTDALVHPGKCVLAVQRVAVHAQNTGLWKAQVQFRLHLLGAHADDLGRTLGAAAWTAMGQRLGELALVATQASGPLVQHQREAAMRTGVGVLALRAQHERRKPPAVEEEDGLLAAAQAFLNGREQRF